MAETISQDTWRDRTITAAPVAAVIVALGSVVITAFGVLANWHRQRRQATLEAWNAWSDTSRDARRLLSAKVGLTALTEAQGRALVDGGPVPDAQSITTEDDRREVVRAIVGVLNGLERLAVGVETGVYDLPTLSRLGGTIVVRWWDRCENYVRARRSATDRDVRQERTYIALELVVSRLNKRRNLDEGRTLDRKRLEILRRNR